jgi:hypothetical protein
MKPSVEKPTGWITKDELFTCLGVTGASDITEHQLERWRGAGLLSRVEQEPLKGRGSIVRYPPGACEQIRAIRALFKVKNREAFVGERLWWLGFPVAEKHWRPKLRLAGKWADRTLWFLDRAGSRLERQDRTLADAAASYRARNIVLSRVVGRLNVEELSTFARVLIDIGLGQFEGFESPVRGEGRTRDEKATISALDLSLSERHAVLGSAFNFVEILPDVLNDVSAAFSMGGLERAADEPEEVIAAVRADARNAMILGMALYEALSWVYGPGAFGLRFLHWIGRKAPDPACRVLLLAMLRLRSVPDAILPAEQIAHMARQAVQIRAISLYLKHLGETDPQFRHVLSARRIRGAFVDTVSLKQWLSELGAAKVSSVN